MSENRPKEQGSYACCDIVFWLTLILLVSGFVSVVLVKSHSVEIITKYKNHFYVWKEGDDYNNLNVTVYIRPFKRTTLIDPKEVCSNATKHNVDKLLFLVVVLSARKNVDLRRQIRNTWGNYTNYKTTLKHLIDLRVISKEVSIPRHSLHFLTFKKPVFKVVFILGKSRDNDDWSQKYIDEEAAKYNDIIQEDFVDTYMNLTLKTIMMLKWVIQNCGDTVRYIMKSDDDAFINMYLMIGKLQDRAAKHDNTSNHSMQEEYTLFGFLHDGYKGPNRYENHKHFIPRRYYPDDTQFPDYLFGSCGYVMSMPVAKVLYKASWDTPYVNMEDVYITGLLPLRSEPRIRLENDSTFNPTVEEEKTYNLLMSCGSLRKSSIGFVNAALMWTLQMRMLDIEELQKCYLKGNAGWAPSIQTGANTIYLTIYIFLCHVSMFFLLS